MNENTSLLEPCCWKVIGQEGDYNVYERLCAQNCDHEHHKAEQDQPGPILTATVGNRVCEMTVSLEGM